MKNTKDKLLNTATRLFARGGIDGVSTRELTKQAGVNLCAINYYFGSKQMLYLAVIDNLIFTLRQNLLNIPSPLYNKTPLQQIKMIILNFFDYLCSDNISDDNALLLINEMISPSCAYNKLYQQVIEPLHQQVSALLAQELHKPKTDRQILILAHTLFGQAAMFRLHKEALLRRMKIKKYTPSLLMEIKQNIHQNCEAIINQARSKI